MPKKKNIDSIVLGSGHAIILGHTPAKLGIDKIYKVIEEHPQDIEQFGLFDTASPNYTTYYPDVTAEDLKPKPDEFIEPLFRMLSNVTVHAKYNPINFPEDVLKKSMKKLVGQTINIDHEWAVGNAIGSIKSVAWQEAYKDGSITIPAGVNAIMKIDGKSNPRIARGIMMEPPSIHSNSVTVSFEWVKSHPEMDDESFWSKLGSYDKKGNLIQRVATNIIAYHETSLVGHGADPFAQKIKDGKIINPKYAKDRYPLNDNLPEGAESYSFMDWKQFDGTGFISNSTIPEESNNEYNNNIENKKNMDEILRMLETIWGLEVDSLTKENYQSTIEGLKSQSDGFKAKAEKAPEEIVIGKFTGKEAIEGEITRLQTIAKDVPEDLADQLVLAADGKILIEKLRTDTNRLYKLTLKDKQTEDPNLLAVIVGADYKTLESLHKQYDELAEDEFELTCTDCKGHNITRASAEAGDGKGGAAGPIIKDTEEVINKFTGSQPAKMTIFKEEVKK